VTNPGILFDSWTVGLRGREFGHIAAAGRQTNRQNDNYMEFKDLKATKFIANFTFHCVHFANVFV